MDENTPFRLAEDVISNLDRLEEEVGLPDLDSVYNEIYQKNTRVGTHDRENVIKTFKFLLYSFVEWNLHDLATAISLDVKGELNLAIDASYVLDICSNFLVVDHSGYVKFAHLSVQEYLKGGRSAIVFSDMDAHAQIAEVCLAYVMSPSAQEIVKKREFDRRQVLHRKVIDKALHRNGRPLRWKRRANVIPAADPYYGRIWPFDPLSLHMYAFALCLEHCELASKVRRQKGTALCSLFATFMSVVEINPAFLTWIQPSPDAKTYPATPRNWTAQKRFARCRTKRDQTRADPQDTFFAACVYGFTEILQDMMRSVVNVDVNRRNENGAPGIWVASTYGHFRVVELLLDEGAEFDISGNRYGSTPLYEAGLGDHPNIVALLLSRGADASARFKGCYTYRIRNESTDREDDADDEDDEAGACIQIVEADETLLHAIARRRSEWGREPMDELKMSSIVSSLLKHGASIEAIDSRLRTPLHLAVSQYHSSTAVSILLHHGASSGALDEKGYTPLMHSATNASTAALELLLKKASIADIVYRNNKEGHSALSLSLQCSKPDAMLLLLNTVDLQAAGELGTHEGDEFLELSIILKKFGYDVLLRLREVLWDLRELRSQRSLINCFRYIAENVDLGKPDWYNFGICNNFREGWRFHELASADTTNEEQEDDTDNDDDTGDDITQARVMTKTTMITQTTIRTKTTMMTHNRTII